MPSTRARLATGLVVLSIIAYATLIAAELLLGALAAGLAWLLAWVPARRGVGRFVAETGSTRARIVGALALLALAYAVVVATRPLVGLLLAETLVLVAWTTGPRGPLVRAAAWLREARADLRAIRAAVDADGADEPVDE
ncbi:MAG: hypothetical protein ABEJ81_06345 [Haloferacaceae archaeon]